MSTIVATDAGERVSAAAAQLQEQARANRTAASPELPKRVYHYTSAAGLCGILDTRKVWASHFHHMNDSDELALGQKVGLELVREHFWDWPDERVRSAVPLAEAVADHRGEASVFLVSFSSEADSLPQWRTYGAEGAGFALGFTLRHGWSFEHGADFAAVQCVYDVDEVWGRLDVQLKELKHALRAQVDDLSGLEKRELGQLYTVARQEIIETWAAAACALKHSAFRDEREWRIIGTPAFSSQPEKYRPSRFGITPYVELEFRPEALCEIRLGPRAKAPEVRHGVRYMTSRHGWGAVEISESKVPFK